MGHLFQRRAGTEPCSDFAGRRPSRPTSWSNDIRIGRSGVLLACVLTAGAGLSAAEECDHFTPFGQPAHKSIAGDAGLTDPLDWTVICLTGQVVLQPLAKRFRLVSVHADAAAVAQPHYRAQESPGFGLGQESHEPKRQIHPLAKGTQSRSELICFVAYV